MSTLLVHVEHTFSFGTLTTSFGGGGVLGGLLVLLGLLVGLLLSICGGLLLRLLALGAKQAEALAVLGLPCPTQRRVVVVVSATR